MARIPSERALHRAPAHGVHILPVAAVLKHFNLYKSGRGFNSISIRSQVDAKQQTGRLSVSTSLRAHRVAAFLAEPRSEASRANSAA